MSRETTEENVFRFKANTSRPQERCSVQSPHAMGKKKNLCICMTVLRLRHESRRPVFFFAWQSRSRVFLCSMRDNAVAQTVSSSNFPLHNNAHSPNFVLRLKHEKSSFRSIEKWFVVSGAINFQSPNVKCLHRSCREFLPCRAELWKAVEPGVWAGLQMMDFGCSLLIRAAERRAAR